MHKAQISEIMLKQIIGKQKSKKQLVKESWQIDFLFPFGLNNVSDFAKIPNSAKEKISNFNINANISSWIKILYALNIINYITGI